MHTKPIKKLRSTAEAVIDTNLEQEDYELELDYAVTYCIEPWLEAHGVEDGDLVVVRYSGATWQRLSGATTTPVADAADLATKFAVNGDYRLVITFDKTAQTLTIKRFSHDEPVGATHVIEKLPAQAE
jgi:hypothetical protein